MGIKFKNPIIALLLMAICLISMSDANIGILSNPAYAKTAKTQPIKSPPIPPMAAAGPEQVQFSAATYSVNENAGTATITVNRSGTGNGTAGVDYTVSNGTAISGSDFTATTGSLSFVNGEMSKTFTVAITDDSVYEGNETINLTLSNPANGASLGTPITAVLTINENDPMPSITFGNATYTANEPGGAATISVNLTGGTVFTSTVNYTITNGTATSGLDYTATSGTLSFTPGQTSKSFTITLLNDGAYEGNETINLTLSSPTIATLSTQNTAVLTIVDDEKCLLELNAATYTLAEGDGTVSVTVNRTGDLTGTMTVNYATSNGTATAGSDYIATTGTLNFGDGEGSKTISIPVTDDAVYESNETFNLTISSPGAGGVLGTTTSGVITIIENDTKPTVQFGAASYSAGEAGGTATVDVTLSGASSATTTIDYATSNGTATAGLDYTAAIGTLTFIPGQTTKTLTINLANDSSYEGNETLNVALNSPTNADLGTQSVAIVTIVDDEKGPLNFSAATYTVAEGAGTVTITVNRSGDLTGTVTVDYSTGGGTATAGSDYTVASGTLSFGDGESSKTCTVAVQDDVLYESDETVNLTLSNPTGGGVLGAPSTATLTITDNDTLPPVKFSAATYNAGEASGTVTITVTRTGDTSFTSTVNYATANGTALAGQDYTATSGTISFNAGETSKTITIALLNDVLPEGNETVNLVLSSPVNAIMGTPNSATLNIDDNEKSSINFTTGTFTTTEDAGVSVITVTRTGDLTGTVSVDYSTSNGTATAGADYDANSGALTFNDGENSKTVTVNILEDTYFEGSQTVNLVLSNPSDGAVLGTTNTAVLTINDNDLAPEIQLSTASDTVSEGAGSITIVAMRTGDTNLASTVDYTLVSGTATAGTDFSLFSGTLNFAPGETNQSFTINILDDLLLEGDETFNVSLSSPTRAILGSVVNETVTIDDDESSLIRFRNNAITVNEGDTASVTIERIGDVTGGASVSYASSNGTAKAGIDYTAISGTAVFNPGESEVTINLLTLDDTYGEEAETVNLTLSSPTGGTIIGAGGQSSATVTIADNDIPAGDLTGIQFETIKTFLALPVGTTKTATLYGNYSLGGMGDITALATWTSSNPDVVSVVAGDLTGKGPGITSIKVTYGQFTKQFTVSVR